MAWCAYLLSAVGLVFVFWRMTKNLKLRRTRRSLRSLVAVLLFTPINMTAEGLWLAPAYLVGSYDWVLGKTEKALEAGVYISVAYILMMFIIMLESVVRRLFGMARAH
ncbi:MAG: energy-coupling factor transporter transmembrane protein EcfT [Oleiphilaceae bacterium]|jgi:energy-coupling factor transporter transmembrane protein EcfT